MTSTTEETTEGRPVGETPVKPKSQLRKSSKPERYRAIDGTKGLRKRKVKLRERMVVGSNKVRRWSKRNKLLLAGVIAEGLIIFFGCLYFIVRLQTVTVDNEQLRIQLRSSEQELVELRPELIRLRDDLRDLAAGRIPNTEQMVFDKVIPLRDKRYVKNITFTRLRNGDDESFEFKAVLQNDTNGILWPDASVYLFDESGIQVGMGSIGGRSVDLQGSSMRPEEIRSYNASIRPTRDEPPAFFMVRLERENLPDALQEAQSQ